MKKFHTVRTVLTITPILVCLLLGSLSAAQAVYRFASSTLLYFMLTPPAAAQEADLASGAATLATAEANAASPRPGASSIPLIESPPRMDSESPDVPERRWGNSAREHIRHRPHGRGGAHWHAYHDFFSGMLVPAGRPAEGFSTASRQ